MAKTISELRNQSIQVRDASAAGENTATRVGTVLNDIVGHIEDYENTQSSNNSSQDAKIEGVKSSLNAEIARAKTEESNLSTLIGTERTERQAAVSREETARIQADNDEKTARQQADNAEQDARIKADNDEKTARENADITLRTMIQTEVSNRQIAVKQEEIRAMAAEKANTQAIEDETARATTAEAAETARAKAEEERLQGEIDNTNTNVETLEDKVNSNHDHLTSEVARLDLTDNEIKADLEAETARAKAAEEANAQTITDEVARAQAAEQAIIFDVSAYNNGAVFDSLSALLGNSNLDTLIPVSFRHGGMTIRFIQGSEQSSDNKYVQFRLMSNAWSTTVVDWQGIDDEPTVGSDNLVKSGGVANKLAELVGETIDLVPIVEDGANGFYTPNGQFNQGGSYYTNGNGVDLSEGIEVQVGDTVNYSIYGHPLAANILAISQTNSIIDYVVASTQSDSTDPSTAFVGKYVVPEGVNHLIVTLNLSANAKPWQHITLERKSAGKIGQLENAINSVDEKANIAVKTSNNALSIASNNKKEINDIVGEKTEQITDIKALCANGTNGFYDHAGSFSSSDKFWSNGDGTFANGVNVAKGDVVKYKVYGHPNMASILAVSESNKVMEFVISSIQSDATDPSTAFVGEYVVPEGVHHLIFSMHIDDRDREWQEMTLTHSEVVTKGRLDTVEEKLENIIGKIDLHIVSPKVIYSVCNDVGKNGNFPRNYSVGLYLDHMIQSEKTEKDYHFIEGSDHTIISSHIATDTYNGSDFPVAVFNDGVNASEKNLTKKIIGSSINDVEFSIVHRSTLNSATSSKKPIVLVIGDSITNGELSRITDDDYAQKYPYHTVCKKLFDMDKIDNDGVGYDVRFVGGRITLSSSSPSFAINAGYPYTIKYTYKGEERTSKSFHLGCSGINISQVLGADQFKDANGNWSLKAFINRYRTLDDNGNKMSIGDANIGTDITSSNINNIELCEPTHVVISLGMNVGGETSQWVQMVETIKSEYPNMIIGIATLDVAGTMFPSLYPDCDETCTIWNDPKIESTTSSADAVKRHNDKMELTARLQNEFFNSSYETRGVYFIPTFWVGLTAEGVGMLERPLADGRSIKTTYGVLPYIHSNGHTHMMWGYQLYSWLKYTLAKM